jgi:hypothetical protein
MLSSIRTWPAPQLQRPSGACLLAVIWARSRTAISTKSKNALCVIAARNTGRSATESVIASGDMNVICTDSPGPVIAPNSALLTNTAGKSLALFTCTQSPTRLTVTSWRKRRKSPSGDRALVQELCRRPGNSCGRRWSSSGRAHRGAELRRGGRPVSKTPRPATDRIALCPLSDRLAAANGKTEHEASFARARREEGCAAWHLRLRTTW